MTAPAPTLPREWARLHPLSPIVRAGRGLTGLVVALAIGFRGGGGNGHRPPYVDIGIVAAVAVAGFVSWLVTRWRIQGSELQVDTGLFRRQQVRVPLTRLQGVDVVRPLLARMLGLAEVRLVLAGHDTGRARLAYLGDRRAQQVRGQLLALAHGLALDTPEPGERPILAVPNRRIVVMHILAGRFTVGIVLLVAVTVAVIERAIPVATIGSLLPVFAATLLVSARQTSAEWEFQVAEAPDGLRLRSGLLQTRAETIPYGRVQAVRWVEPLWWRPFGWVRLEVDVARRRNSDRADRSAGVNTRALLPAGSREEARWLLSRVFPGAVAELSPTLGTPGRARWRAPLAHRFLRCHHDATYIACCTGRFRPDVVIVPLDKLQSLRFAEGPVSRRLGLASLSAHTAGQRFTAHARFRDVVEARQLLAALPDLARAARLRMVRPATAAPPH